MTSRVFLIAAVVAFAGTAPARAAGEFDQGHAAFDQLLKQRVRDGWVDYAALKANPNALAAYLDSLAHVQEEEFSRWSEKDRLAFLINLYNAATLKLIVDNYPIKSIRGIGGLFGSPWKQEVVRLFGRVVTLDDVEHGMVRRDYHDARVHFALVCGARGCPPLRSEAFVGVRLEEQLDDQGRRFFSQTQKNRVEASELTVYVSPIFKWFSEDFEAQAGSVLKFITPFFPEAQRRALASGEFNLRYTDYDWSLNDQARK